MKDTMEMLNYYRDLVNRLERPRSFSDIITKIQNPLLTSKIIELRHNEITPNSYYFILRNYDSEVVDLLLQQNKYNLNKTALKHFLKNPNMNREIYEKVIKGNIKNTYYNITKAIKDNFEIEEKRDLVINMSSLIENKLYDHNMSNDEILNSGPVDVKVAQEILDEKNIDKAIRLTYKITNNELLNHIIKNTENQEIQSIAYAAKIRNQKKRKKKGSE